MTGLYFNQEPLIVGLGPRMAFGASGLRWGSLTVQEFWLPCISGPHG